MRTRRCRVRSPIRQTRRQPQSYRPDGTSMVAGTLRVAGRVWIEKGGTTYLAWGRIVLLERIREYGSISAAARSMGMGYPHAWDLVEKMNRMSPSPLVVKSTGGTRGGGAVLTPRGEAAVEMFRSLVADFQSWLMARPRVRFGRTSRR
jgi:molybdate transport system regulatory protein